MTILLRKRIKYDINIAFVGLGTHIVGLTESSKLHCLAA